MQIPLVIHQTSVSDVYGQITFHYSINLDTNVFKLFDEFKDSFLVCECI